MDNIRQNARQLRKNMTKQERILWSILKERKFFGYRFRRQFPIGNYIVDFINREKNIIIEIDGGQHNTDECMDYDNASTNFLNSEGYTFIRFWNNDIDNNLDGVYRRLKEVFDIKE